MRNGAPFSKPRVRLYGATGDAQNYLGAAYNLLFKVRQFCGNTGAPVFAMQRSLPDGAVVQAAILGNEEIVSCFPPTYVSSVGDTEKGEPLVPLHGGFIIHPRDDEVGWWPTYVRTRAYVSAPEGGKKLFRTPANKHSRVSLDVDTTLETKAVSWTGLFSGKECVVTWDHGLGSRYRFYPDQDVSGRVLRFEGGEPVVGGSGMPGVCVWGQEIPTVWEYEDGAKRTLNVVGAAAFGNHLVFVSHVDLDYRDDPNSSTKDNKITRAAAFSRTVTVFYGRGGGWKVAGAFFVGEFLRAPWFFSPTGSRASCVLEVLGDDQRLLHIDLTVDEETGEVVATLTQEQLEDAEGPFLLIDNEAVVNDVSRPLGWQQPSERDEFTREGNLPWTVGDTAAALAQEIANRLDPPGDIDIRSRVGYADAIANWSTWRSWYTYAYVWVNASRLSVYGTVQLGFYRTVTNVEYDLTLNRQYSRRCGGRRYVAVDYGADGELLTLRVDLESRVGSGGGEIGHVVDLSIFQQTVTTGVSMDAYYTHSEQGQRKSSAVTGHCAWSFKLNGEELFSIAGGVKSTYEQSRSAEFILHSSDPAFNAGTTYSNVSHGDSDIFAERGYLIDADLRCAAYVLEKTRIDFFPAKNDLGIPSDSLVDFGILEKLRGTSKESSELIVSVGGSEVVHEVWEGPDHPIFIVDEGEVYMQSLHMQLMPRIYPTTGYEEFRLPISQVVNTVHGAPPIPKPRHYLYPLFDPQEIIYQKGCFQSRYREWVVSASDATTSRYFSIHLGEVKIRDQRYFNKASIQGAVFDIPGAFVVAAEDHEEGSQPDVDSLRLLPIHVV